MRPLNIALAGAGLLALGAVFLPGAARADMADIRKADNAVSLEAGATNLDYVETQSGGGVLDSEKGWLPTARLGISMLAFEHAAIPDLYLHADVVTSLGSTHYDGALCDRFGNCTPATGTTNDAIVIGTFQAGRALPLGRALLLTPFAELGYRYWARDLTGPGGYLEQYHNWQGMGGVMAQYSPASRWVLTLSGAAGTTFGASLDALGSTFALGDKPIWRAQGKLGYRLTDRVELTASAEYVSFGYGASLPNANSYYEPDSTTRQTSLLIGAAYHFF